MLHTNKPPYLGAAYYPELWPAEQVEQDIRQMKEAGCNLMRIAEFAWITMEPKEGVFEFDWLQNVLDKLHAVDIAVILCTPTATPPQWLTTKYPETLLMYADGSRKAHGGRRHNCPNSSVMREKNRIIVTELAKRFGKHPAVVGWQIDNEVYPYTECWCPLCRQGFREYLKKRYGTVAEFNAALDLDRWSIRYDSFESIEPPREWAHPTIKALWFDFQCDSWIDFIHEQAAVLRQYSSAPIGTDTMPFMGHNYPKLMEKLDVVQFNHYNSFENPQHGLAKTPLWFAYLRSLKPDVPFWNTETQANWNGSTFNPLGIRQEGFCRVNSWLPFALGGEMNLYWHWRAHPAGHEIVHGSVVSACGRFLYSVGEIQQTSRELEAAADFLAETKPMLEAALHCSYSAWLAFKEIPYYGTEQNELRYIDDLGLCLHDPLVFSHHIPLDVISQKAPLAGYKVLFSPLLPVVEDIEAITKFVEEGGIWVVGPASDFLNKNLRRSTTDVFYHLEKLADIYCRYQLPNDNIPYDITFAEGQKCEGSLCYDGFVAKPEQTLATYKNGPLKGLAAITKTQVGKGAVIVLGTMPRGASLARLLKELPLCPCVDASENILAVPRVGEKRRGLVIAEIFNRPGRLFLEKPYREILTNKRLQGEIAVAAADVLVLEEE